MTQKSRFNKFPLPDLVFFQEGPGLRKWQWSNDGMKVINVTNILGDAAGTVDQTNTDKYISDLEFETRYKHFEIDNGDIVVASSGNTYGKIGRIKESNLPLMMNTSVIRLRSLDTKKLDNEFLYCFLRSPLFKNQVEQFVIGGAQPNFGPTHLKKMFIWAPDIYEQARIGELVAKYDKLIENNGRRIHLLEESARLLYREWFVHLRFPGHEHVKVVEGVPEGWLDTTAYEVMDVLSGGTPKTSVNEFWGGDIPFFTPKDATDSVYVQNTEKTITDSGLKKCNSKFYPRETLFITARGTVGKLNLAQVPMAMNQSCYALVAKEPLNQKFLYCALEASIAQYKARATGAVFDAIVVDTFKRIPFVLPPENLINEFTETIEPTFEQIDKLLTMNRRLEEARDILLPRLMNGDIAV